VGLSFDPCLRVLYITLHFSDQHLAGKSRLHNCKYHFSLYKDFFEYQYDLHNKGKGV